MKELEKQLKDCRTLVFVDLEGTGISHEMIEIGAFKVTIRDDFTVKKIFKPYKAYVKAKHPIGHVVTKLTGITEKMIKEKGISFRQVQNELKKYLKKDYAKCRFLTYGTHDKVIMTSSAENNMDSSMDDARYFCKKHFDWSAFMSRYIKSKDGNPLSQSNALKLFGVELKGTAHDAADDARNLISLYQAFLEKKDIVEQQYREVLINHSHLPGPLRDVLIKLDEGESVSPETFDSFVKEALK